MISRSLRWLFGASSRAVRNHRRRPWLWAEALESRHLLATIPVTTTADVLNGGDGLTSLREAVIQANGSAGDDEIMLPPGTLLLDETGTPEDAAARGDLDVTETTGKLTIQGAVSGPSIIDAAGIDRVLHVLAGAELILRDVLVQNGLADVGGGILNAGRVTLVNVQLLDNRAGVRGGGIENGSFLNVQQSRFAGNRVGDIASPTSGGLGGALNISLGNVTIASTQFTDNTAGGGGTGGAINMRGGTVEVSLSTFAQNRAGEGGAVATAGGNALLTDSTFTQNQAIKDGGRGGAVDGRGEVRVTHSTFTQNSASGLAGIGGALANANFMEVVNSTISGNSAGKSGVSNLSRGGGIYNSSNFRLLFSTVVHNVQIGGGISGGIFNETTPPGTTTLLSSIVALNGVGADNAPDFRGAFTSLGGNVIGNRTGAVGTFLASDQTGGGGSPLLNPLIGPLASNGGPTQTHELLTGSPAIDRGVIVVGMVINSDQRHLLRPVGIAHDAGAFEVQPPPPANRAPVGNSDAYTVTEDALLLVAADAGVLANDTDADGDALTAALVNGPAIGDFNFQADGSFDYQPPADFFGTVTFSYRASDGELTSDVTQVTLDVSPVNDPPAAAGDAYALDEDTLLTVAADEGLLANDSDPDGDALIAILSAGPSHGDLTLNEDGSFTYQPDADYFGSDSFTYRASDGVAPSDPITVALEIHDVGDVLEIAIDIQPGDPSNAVELKPHERISVAILSTSIFDARLVDVSSLRFGSTSYEDSLARHKKPPTFKDVNGDGRLDLIVQISSELTGLAPEDTEALVRGQLLNGTFIAAAGPVLFQRPGKGRS